MNTQSLNTKSARRAVVSTSALIAASAVLVSALTGSGTASAMPRLHVSAPTSSHSPSVATVQQPAGVSQTGDPADANRRSQAIQLEPYTTPIGAVVTARSSMEAYLTASLYDVHNTWTRMFAGWNYTAPTVTFQFPEKGVAVNTCGEDTNDMTLQYCPTDDTITINQDLARNLWLGSYGSYTIQGTGDMSVSLFVAHEYGHNVQNELGLTATTSAQKERGADCFAGVWAKDASGRGILDDGDIAEGLQGLDLLAEHEGQSDGGVHGTPAERQQAFGVGFEQGARACVTTYLS